MSPLVSTPCEPCRKDSPALSDQEIENLLTQIDGWQHIEESGVPKLKRRFKTKNYANSIRFTNAIAELAEQENHHPLLIVEYGSVTVIWWTHSIQGLHKNDFIMAAKTSELF